MSRCEINSYIHTFCEPAHENGRQRSRNHRNHHLLGPEHLYHCYRAQRCRLPVWWATKVLLLRIATEQAMRMRRLKGKGK